ncbi:hypothetical protein [Paraburkholderia aspalathi]|uniref:hypothetical protein n=1 Tax=Paraburkholderia aspalathi TaxID=1324617 RepID=UPI001B1FE5F1|nr:hypothetical protein [Paraburkholderia aspalathi]CAE6846447.1 hypothetical protein R20943_07358 [Paraburkholderia aspalathi]
MFSFLRSRRQERQEKEAQASFDQGRIAALEGAFGMNLAHLKDVFEGTPEHLKDENTPSYPGAVWLGDIGVRAFVQTETIEPNRVDAYMDLVQTGRQAPVPRHFITKPRVGYDRHVLVSAKPEFSGEMVRLLTNDVELLTKLAAARFNPPVPWVAFPESGPLIFDLQGDTQYWYEHVWDPYWENLSLAEQSDFLTKRKPERIEDWEDWVEAIRTRDPRYREQLKQEYRHEE